MSPRLRFSCALTVLFLLGTGFVAWHHELWRDEMQAWLISRDSPTWTAIFRMGRYEGTPPLWHLLLRPVALLTHRTEAVQALNVLLAAATFFLVCRFGPFTRLQQTLLLFNYYLFYEYAIVCRQYLLGVFFLVLAVILFPADGRSPWGFAWAIVGAALTSVFSLIVAAALAVACWGPLLPRLASADPARPRLRPALCAGLLAALGFGIAVWSMLPAPDSLYAPAAGWHFGWDRERLLRVAVAFTDVHILLPRPEGFFWIPPWLTELSVWQYLAAALALPLLGGGLLCFRRALPAFLLYLVGSLGLALFLYAKYLGFTRHAGFLFVTLLLAFWLKRSRMAADSRIATDRWAGVVLTVLLAVQAVTGIWAARLEVARAFSSGKAAAGAITAENLDRAFLAAWPDSAGAVFAGYLDRRVYYPQSDRLGSFSIWDTHRDEGMTDAEALRRTRRAAGGRPAVIIVTHELPEALVREQGLETLGSFQGSLAPFEDYYVYRLSAPRPPAVRVDRRAGPAAGLPSRLTS